jgi:hypothetical protein
MPYFVAANCNAHNHVLSGGGVVVREKQQVPPLRFGFLAEAEAPVGKTEFCGLDVLSQV